jgi:hypothetical protein
MRGLPLVVALGIGLVASAAGAAQVAPHQQPTAADDPCARVRADVQQKAQAHAQQTGRGVQPDAVQEQAAESGCPSVGSGAPTPDKDARDIDEMYDRLMKQSAEDLKALPPQARQPE